MDLACCSADADHNSYLDAPSRRRKGHKVTHGVVATRRESSVDMVVTGSGPDVVTLIPIGVTEQGVITPPSPDVVCLPATPDYVIAWTSADFVVAEAAVDRSSPPRATMTSLPFVP